MRLIDADELEKFIQQYNTDDKTDKALYNFAHNIINYCPTVEAYTWQQIAQIKYEIYQEVGNIDRSQYTTERAQGRADGIIFALGMAIGIIGKYCNKQQEENGSNNKLRDEYAGLLHKMRTME